MTTVSFDDLDSFDDEPTRPAKQGGVVEWTNPCPKCRGTGRFISSSGRDCGECFTCRGKGKLTFKTSPEERQRASQQRATRKAETMKAGVEAFIAQYPAEHAWAAAASKRGFEFATSLLTSVLQYGSLTERQLEALRKCMAKDAERNVAREARREEAKGIDVSRIAAIFAKVRAERAAIKGRGDSTTRKQPTLRVDGLELQLAKEASKNPGHVYVKRVGDDAYLGKISPEGVYSPSFAATADDLKVISDCNADPLALAVKYGRDTNRCACCGLELTNPESKRLGIGPICREKWGL